MNPQLITKQDLIKYTNYSESLRQDIANAVNRILQDKLTPYYCKKSLVDSQKSIVLTKNKEPRDTHIMYAFTPVEIPPIKIEQEYEEDPLYATETIEVPASLQSKKFKVTFDEIK